MLSRVKKGWRWAVDSYVLFVVLGVVLGLVLVIPALGVATSSDGTVAVVHIDGTIDGEQSTAYAAQLATARQEADAVVIVANSGGGSAPASEEMYMQTVRTNESMPVIATVDAAAASGAYYAIAPAEEIYVKPSSMVGSVGVVTQARPQIEPNDQILTTGPNKISGGDERAFAQDLANIQTAFVSAVYEHRSDRLALQRTELANAATYTGLDAADNGLADDIGDRERAIAAAADAAGIDDPEVVVMRPEDAEATFLMRSTYLASDATDREIAETDLLNSGDAGIPTYLMVPPAVVGTDAEVVSSQKVVATAGASEDADGARSSADGSTPPANETSTAGSSANETSNDVSGSGDVRPIDERTSVGSLARLSGVPDRAPRGDA